VKSATPLLTLCSLLLAAMLVAVGGTILAQREQTTRAMSDRKILLTVAADLQAELKRLDAQFAQDLQDLALAIDPGNTTRAQQLCRSLHGVRVCSILRQHSPDEPMHVRAEGTDNTSPAATLKPLLWKNLVVVSAARLLEERRSAESGWDIVSPLAPYAFYSQRISPTTGVVLTVDGDAVESITRMHIQAWMGQRFAPMRAHQEINRVESPRGFLVAESSVPPAERSPDFAIALTSRWGAWQVLSWDRMVTIRSHHLATLIGSSALAVTLALAGIMLARAQRRSQRLAEQRVSFVNRVSHELGTPLTNMLLNLDLARELVDDAPAVAKQRLALVEEETRRLARLTTNVLTFSRSERGSLQIKAERCVPDDVLGQVLDHFAPALERRGIVVEKHFLAGSPSLLDGDALAQIVANLISNVEKYAAGGSWLGIESTCVDGWLTVRVADQGPGIPNVDRERIFLPFERLADQVNEGSSGTGLGLSISRDLARRMGGTLVMKDTETGSLFELRVPCPSTALEVENPRDEVSQPVIVAAS
jgi:signal transduction histidine kinase